jgi:hypothetical protein
MDLHCSSTYTFPKFTKILLHVPLIEAKKILYGTFSIQSAIQKIPQICFKHQICGISSILTQITLEKLSCLSNDLHPSLHNVPSLSLIHVPLLPEVYLVAHATFAHLCWKMPEIV